MINNREEGNSIIHQLFELFQVPTFPGAQTVNNLPAMWETRLDPWVGNIS